MAAHLMSLGFAQELAVDQCFFVHKERQIDFGLFVDDIEASADDKQLGWCKLGLKTVMKSNGLVSRF